MRTWIGISLVLLLMAGLQPSAWANNELHPGGRLFFPLWDVSTPNRLTFIIVTRQALTDGQSIRGVGTANVRLYTVNGEGKCLPRGANGSTTNVNRIDLGGTSVNPVFVDDVHFEYYGRTCISADEIVHMSCADIDLFLLSSAAPRFAFQVVAGDGRGALDVSFVTNGQGDPGQRKLENSLMGSAIITDVAEGWVASYAAAAAKALPCATCADIDGGEPVGYENYPMEVYLPFAFADGFPAPGGALRNFLSLWGPALLAGGNLTSASINLDFRWWDGRERPFLGSVSAHALIRPLGGPTIAGLDSPLDPSRFNVANFTCGHNTTGTRAENDGFPRSGTDATNCGSPTAADTAHPSDNFESAGGINVAGHSIQNSTPIGWWRFRLRPDNLVPPAAAGFAGDENANHSGRGLVGVVLSAPQPRIIIPPGIGLGLSSSVVPVGPPFSVPVGPPPGLNPPGVAPFPPGSSGLPGIAVGDATRLWHEDPCEIGQSGQTVGPPHERDKLVQILKETGNSTDFLPLFNVFKFDGQAFLCAFGLN